MGKREEAGKGPGARNAGADEGARRGRPTGKRSSPEYVPLTVYVRRETHRGVKIALLREDDGGEMSQLVEELLSGWLVERERKAEKRKK